MTRTKGYCTLLFIIVASIGTSRAQVITLDTVLARVNRSNPTLKSYDEKANALHAYSEGASAWMPPMVGAGTFMTPYPGQKVMESRDKGFLMIAVEQSIPNARTLNATKKYLDSKSAIAMESRAIEFNELRAEARIAYYQWSVLESRKSLLQRSKDIVTYMLNTAQIRYPYNKGSLSEIYKTESRLDELDNMMLSTQASIDEQKFKLTTLMNLPPTTALEPDITLRVIFSPATIALDTALLSGTRSDIKRIQRSIDMLYYDREVQRTKARPEFKLQFNHMSPLGTGMPAQFTAMGMVSIPIAPWSSKMYQAEVKGIEHDILAMHRDQEALLNAARGRASFLYSQILSMQRQLDNYEKKIVPLLRKNYDATMLAYSDNRTQLPDVLDAWDALNAMELERLEKKDSYYMLIVNYEKELEK